MASFLWLVTIATIEDWSTRTFHRWIYHVDFNPLHTSHFSKMHFLYLCISNFMQRYGAIYRFNLKKLVKFSTVGKRILRFFVRKQLEFSIFKKLQTKEWGLVFEHLLCAILRHCGTQKIMWFYFYGNYVAGYIVFEIHGGIEIIEKL